MRRCLFRCLFACVRYIPSIRRAGINIGSWLRLVVARGLVDYCGKGANIEYGCVFNEGGRGVRIGNYAGIGIRAQIGPYVSIGDFTMMGPDVIILTRNHRFSDINKPMCLQSYLDYKPVIIEDDVWIGQRVIILPGVTIGKGSILGAGAVIAKSIPQYSIVVGNPAQVIKSRLHAIE